MRVYDDKVRVLVNIQLRWLAQVLKKVWTQILKCKFYLQVGQAIVVDLGEKVQKENEEKRVSRVLVKKVNVELEISGLLDQKEKMELGYQERRAPKVNLERLVCEVTVDQ